MGLSNRWFVEDRKEDNPEEATEASKKVILNSTLIRDRLKRMINEDLAKTYIEDEDFDNPRWEVKVIANNARRKALRDVLKLLP